MLMAIILGAVIGYVLAIPPGPIGMAAIRTGMRQGWSAAVKLSIGAGLFDILYCSVAMLATSAVVDLLNSLERSNPFVTVVIQIVVVAVMIVFGVMQMKERPIPATDEVRPALIPTGWLDRVKSHGPFFVGVGFALANLANPTFFPSLAALSTFIQKSGWYLPSFANNLLFSVTFGIGQALWLMTLVRLLLMYKHRMTPKFIHRIQQFTGITLIGFGTAYGIRILTVTKWSELARLVLAF
jgi:threonine/homoserine/homoserine lactone efflux protein